jgi:hypothetical protein
MEVITMNPKNPNNAPDPLAVYSVPSANVPGDYYTVELYPNRATACDCPWGRKEDAPSRCWHVRAAQLMEHAEDVFYPFISSDIIRRAQSGDIHSQLYLLKECVTQLAWRDEWSAASRAAEVLTKYLQALSVQGADPQSAARKEEAAPAAASRLAA